MIAPHNKLDELLNDGDALTVAQMSERLNVGVRQIRRYLDDLRNMGRVIEESEEKDGRRKVYFIPEEHRRVRAHVVELTSQQMLALAVASRASEAVLDSTPLLPELKTANKTILAKLAEASEGEGPFDIGAEADHWYFPDAPRVPLLPDVITTLVQGMRDTTTVEISYYSMRSGTQRWRKVDPMTFVYRDGSWLMCAWCHDNAAHRTFSLADVHDARLCRWEGYTEEDKQGDDKEEDDATPWLIFERRPFNVEEFFRDTFHAVGGDTEVVRLLVAAPQARSFLRKYHHPTQQIEEEHADGSMTVSFETAGLAEVRSFILGWGAGVTVLEPEELRQQLREVALEVAQKYS